MTRDSNFFKQITDNRYFSYIVSNAQSDQSDNIRLDEEALGKSQEYIKRQQNREKFQITKPI